MQKNPLLDSMNERVEELKTAKDISEIEQLLTTYQQTGYLDRAKAIEKICGARSEEPAVQATLMPKNPLMSVPYEKVPNSQLVNELAFVLQYLTEKSIVKGSENQNGVPHC